MKIRINSFCSMSRNPDWLEFLKRTDQALYYELNDFLRTQKGCKTAKNKMLDIYKKLYSRGHGEIFEQFIQSRFPYVIENKKPTQATPKPAKKVFHHMRSRGTDQSVNKHGVFKSYRPDMLTFPQKLIIVDNNPKALIDKTKKFILDKVSPDYIIIDDRVYIEYFLPKYKNEAMKIPPRAREIAQFKMKANQKRNDENSHSDKRNSRNRI